MALSVLAYNLTRVMNIVGIKPLTDAIAARDRTGLGFTDFPWKAAFTRSVRCGHSEDVEFDSLPSAAPSLAE